MTLINIWRQKIAHHFSQKSSQIGPLIAYNTIGRAVWTPRSYSALSEEGYQKNVIVYRAVSLIARSAASVQWQLYYKDQELYNHPLLTLLRAPNPTQAFSSFMEAVISYLLLAGNSYIELVRSGEGTPLELYALRPDRMKVIPDAQANIIGYEYSTTGYSRTIEGYPSPVLHLRCFNPLNDWYGMSPLEAAATAIDQHNAVSHHNLALLQNGGRPSGALLFRPSNGERYMSEKQREELRQNLRKAYEGSENAGKIMVLEGDFTWQEMGLSLKDLDFINGKNLSAREIAQAYGIAPLLVGIQGDATFANYREARFHLWEDTVLPLLEMIISAFNSWLVSSFGRDLRLTYAIDSIPALAPRREGIWERINQANFLTINEKRKALGYKPLSKHEQEQEFGKSAQ
jgi:HK97 family phage portal protein